MNEKIRNVYDTLSPTEEQIESMLHQIRAGLAETPPEMNAEVGKKPVSRLLAISLMAVLLAFGVTAYAQGWFGLGDLNGEEYTVIKDFTREEILARNKELAEAVARGEDPAEKENFKGRDIKSGQRCGEAAGNG